MVGEADMVGDLVGGQEDRDMMIVGVIGMEVGIMTISLMMNSIVDIMIDTETVGIVVAECMMPMTIGNLFRKQIEIGN